MSLIKNLISGALRTWTGEVMCVRYRYHADKIKRGPLVRRMGYEDPIVHEGTLAHTGPSGGRINELPIYVPADNWMQKKALFGQNDYIDILGNKNIHPTRIMYNVPRWLRGVKGNEYQILLRQLKCLKHGNFLL